MSVSPGSYVAVLPETDYETALEIQRNLNDRRNRGEIPDTIIVLSHPDVYTTGIHRNPGEIIDPMIRVINVERGGSATYHGKGQIVVYFIINMRDRGINIRDLIISIEKAVSLTLEKFGIIAEGRLKGETGVWVGHRKICSVGLAVRGFSTLHGIALNVSTDLSKFAAILPCGMPPHIMTSMKAETGTELEINEVKDLLIRTLVRTINLREPMAINNLEKLREISVGNGL